MTLPATTLRPRSRTGAKSVRSAGPIEGIRTKTLRVIPDGRGRLFEMLRRDDELFIEFGQVYCTTVNPGIVKGWHYHKKQVDNFVCVSGMIKLVAYDSRRDSPTKGQINEFFIGTHNPLLVQIPPGVLHGFKGLSRHEAIVINISTEPYHHGRPDEYRVDPHQNHTGYDWNQRDG